MVCTMCNTARSGTAGESKEEARPVVVKRSKIGAGLKLTRDVKADRWDEA